MGLAVQVRAAGTAWPFGMPEAATPMMLSAAVGGAAAEGGEAGTSSGVSGLPVEVGWRVNGFIGLGPQHASRDDATHARAARLHWRRDRQRTPCKSS